MVTFCTISKKSLFALLFSAFIKITSLYKISFVIGSYAACFSCSSLVTPLAGSFGGVTGSLSVGCLAIALRALLGGLLSTKILVYHIPGIFASLYWASRSSLIRVVVPMTCLALFIMHPTGCQAWYYTLIWLIPVALFFMPYNNLFLQALGSTLVAHAVGSVLWLYTVPMPASVWIAMIPLVIIERLLFASGMVVMYHGIQQGVRMFGVCQEYAARLRVFVRP